MTRDLILGQLHPDMACAIALGIVEDLHVTVTADAISLFDPRLRSTRTQTGWLAGADPLDEATRVYLHARRDAMLTTARPSSYGSGWRAAAAAKTRDASNTKAIQAKTRAFQLLEQRGVIGNATRSGLTVNQPR
jgi:hypothetical protein